jgi:NAD+ kinase
VNEAISSGSISPKLNAFVIVPICPHTLSARPLVIPDDEIITICTDNKYFASCDGQEFYEFKNEIEIKKSKYHAKLALLNDSDFYSILRNKLHWGVSPACIK